MATAPELNLNKGQIAVAVSVEKPEDQGWIRSTSTDAITRTSIVHATVLKVASVDQDGNRTFQTLVSTHPGHQHSVASGEPFPIDRNFDRFVGRGKNDRIRRQLREAGITVKVKRRLGFGPVKEVRVIRSAKRPRRRG